MTTALITVTNEAGDILLSLQVDAADLWKREADEFVLDGACHSEIANAVARAVKDEK